MNKKTALALTAVLALGLLAGAAILHREGDGHDAHDDHGHAETPPAAPKPPPAAASGAAPAASTAEAGAHVQARITDEQLRHNGVQLAAAGPARIAGTLSLMGEVALNQDLSVVVTPRLAGAVHAVHANAGDRVQRGQLLAVIVSPALAEQRAELLAAEKRLALARQTHEREHKLWQDKISAEQDYLASRQALQEAEIGVEALRQKLAALGATAAAGTQGLARLEVRAPIAGVIVDKKISTGETLREDTAIFQLADLSSVWVTLAVPAQDLARLQTGAQARVTSAAFEAEGQGRVTHVGALMGEQSRSATARVLLPNPQGLWRPGLPVSVSLSQDAAAVAVAVPADTLQTLDGRTVVFVRRGQQFEAVTVQTGRADGRQVEILQGLTGGERVAAKNSFVVKAELGKGEAGHEH
jgi:cobalt-zinc-cadmium efflux system membrane fusion protein